MEAKKKSSPSLSSLFSLRFAKPIVVKLCLICMVGIGVAKPAVAMQFIFSAGAGLNVLAENEEDIVKEKNLEKISSTVALSYSIKAGILFYEHYAIFIAYGYDKRPDLYYKLNALSEGMAYQESQKNYSLGIDASYYFWPYLNTFNIAISLHNRALMKAIRVTTLEYNDNEEVSALVKPRSVITTHYLLSPQFKLHYRIVENNATLYFAFQYHFIFPQFEQYPVFLFGVDIHFSLQETEPMKFQ